MITPEVMLLEITVVNLELYFEVLTFYFEIWYHVEQLKFTWRIVLDPCALPSM